MNKRIALLLVALLVFGITLSLSGRPHRFHHHSNSHNNTHSPSHSSYEDYSHNYSSPEYQRQNLLRSLQLSEHRDNPINQLQLLTANRTLLGDQYSPVLANSLVLLKQHGQERSPFPLLAKLRQVQLTDDAVTAAKEDLQHRAIALSLANSTEYLSRQEWRQAADWLAPRFKAIQEIDPQAAELFQRVGKLADELGIARDWEKRLQTLNRAEVVRWEQEQPTFVTVDHVAALDSHGAIEKLRSEIAAQWSSPPSTSVLDASLHELARTKICEHLAEQLRVQLSFKAFIAGHPVAALELLPKGAEPEQYAAILRDLKVLTSKEGTAQSWPARQFAAHTSGTLLPIRGPPGLLLMIPEDVNSGPRERVQESALADLPVFATLDETKRDLEAKIQDSEEHLRTRVEEQIREVRQPREAEAGKLVRELWQHRFCHARLKWQHNEPLQPKRDVLVKCLVSIMRESYYNDDNQRTAEYLVDWLLRNPGWKVESKRDYAVIRLDAEAQARLVKDHASYYSMNVATYEHCLAQLQQSFGTAEGFSSVDLALPTANYNQSPSDYELDILAAVTKDRPIPFNDAERQIIVCMLRAGLDRTAIEEIVAQSCPDQMD